MASGKRGHGPSNSVTMSGTAPVVADGGDSDPVKRISDDLIYQTRSSWSDEKEKVCI